MEDGINTMLLWTAFRGLRRFCFYNQFHLYAIQRTLLWGSLPSETTHGMNSFKVVITVPTLSETQFTVLLFISI